MYRRNRKRSPVGRTLAIIIGLALGLLPAYAGTPTADKGYTKPTPNADNNVWGILLNANLDLIDANISGINVVPITSTTVAAPQPQFLVQKLTGALTGATRFNLPTVPSFYIIDNETTGAFTLQVGTAAIGGNAITVRQGQRALVYCDSANVYHAPTTPQGLGFDQLDAIIQSAGPNGQYNVTYTGAPIGYQPGTFFVFRTDKASVGGDTENINGVGALPMYKPSPTGSPVGLASGDLQSGALAVTVYDPALNSGSGGFDVVAGIAPPIQSPFNGGTISNPLTLNGTAINEAEVSIATNGGSSQTLAIGAAGGNFINITGTGGTITAFDSIQAGVERWMLFTASVTFQAGPTLIPIGSSNFTTGVGDMAVWRSEGGGTWLMTGYQTANGQVINNALSTKGLMQGGTDNNFVATAFLTGQHDGVAKAWGSFSSGQATLASSNVASLTRNSAGNYTIHFTTPFAAAAYACTATTENNAGNTDVALLVSKATGSVTINTENSSTGAATDLAFDFVCFGRQ